MTEAEWDACADPAPMLESLSGRVSERKLRLFAVACCRRIGDLLSPPGNRAVEVAERWADGRATEQEVRDAYRASSGFAAAGVFPAIADAFGVTVLSERAGFAAAQAATWAARYRNEAINDERAAQAGLLRCVIGNPRRLVALGHDLLAWNDGAVRRMAQSIYNARAFDRLPLLADALEEAGCADAAILAHCRGPGEHVRGCWVVDLLLGKK